MAKFYRNRWVEWSHSSWEFQIYQANGGERYVVKKQPDVFQCNLVAFLTNKLFSSFVCQGSKLYLFLVVVGGVLPRQHKVLWGQPMEFMSFTLLAAVFFCRVFFTWTPQILRHFLIFSWGLLFLETAEFLLLGLDQEQMVEVLLLKNLVEKL